MSGTLSIAFRSNVSVIEQQDGAILLEVNMGPHTQPTWIKQVSPGLRKVIQCLASTGAPQTELDQLVCAHDGIGGLAVWYFWQQQFRALHLLCYPLVYNHSRIATLLSASSDPVPPVPALQEHVVCSLSRFTYCRLDPHLSSLRLETPRSPYSLLLHEPSGWQLIHLLSTPKTVEELGHELSYDAQTIEGLLAWLVSTQLVVLHHADGSTDEECHPTLPYWEFHDLLFHSRSRSGRSEGRFGGTYRFGQDHSPCPVVKPDMTPVIYPLYRPDLDRLMEEEPSFSSVLAARSSTRHFDDQHPLTVHQIGEFLYRVARVQDILQVPVQDSVLELSKRPYPAGGALYELDIYLAVQHCLDVPQGLYQYNPLHHHLCKLTEGTPALVQFVQASAQAAQQPQEAPSQAQVLLLITSRYPRLSWKYESIAYATTLKNTGALLQTMYLVASAMGLGGTAIGCGNADQFARLSGIEYLAEPLVGEFLLGTTRASS